MAKVEPRVRKATHAIGSGDEPHAEADERQDEERRVSGADAAVLETMAIA